MQRPNYRYQTNATGPSPNRFRSPPPGFVGGQGNMHSPPWQYFGGPPSPFGPRFGQFSGSPHTPPGEIKGGNDDFRRNSGSGGRSWQRGSSPRQYTPQRPYDKRGGPHRHSPFQSPSPRQGGYQGSPRTSSPFRSPRGRQWGPVTVERLYKPSMVEDPWANLPPIAVKDVQKKFGIPQTPSSSKQSRYY